MMLDMQYISRTDGGVVLKEELESRGAPLHLPPLFLVRGQGVNQSHLYASLILIF